MKNKILFAILAVLALLVTVVAASADVPGPDPIPMNITPNQSVDLFDITSDPVNNGVVGELYSYQIQVLEHVDVTSYTYTLITKPTGMTVNSAGLITWTPSTAGTYHVKLSVKGVFGLKNETEYQEYDIVVTDDVDPEPSGMLEITKVVVKVGGSRNTVDDGETVDDEAELGDDIEIEVTVENNFNIDDDDTIIRDIEMELSSDLDDADGLDDSISKLRAGDDEKMTFSFTLDPETVIPSDAPFDIDIDVQGETDDGTVYSDSWTITLDMDTKSKDLYIMDAQVSPTSFRNCVDNKIRVNVDLRNIGTKDLEDAAVRMQIEDLNIDEFIKNIELDEGDDDSYSGYVTVPAGAEPGTYTLEVAAYPVRNTNSMTDVAAFDITVSSCQDVIIPDDTEEEEEEPPVIIPEVNVQGTPVATAVGSRGLFSSDNALYIILLVVLAVLLLIVIILLIARMMKE
ncbi:MAG: hypothetical protein ACP5N3_04530 [Candidatus Nanoarchaeia archaeon]